MTKQFYSTYTSFTLLSKEPINNKALKEYIQKTQQAEVLPVNILIEERRISPEEAQEIIILQGQDPTLLGFPKLPFYQIKTRDPQEGILYAGTDLAEAQKTYRKAIFDGEYLHLDFSENYQIKHHWVNPIQYQFTNETIHGKMEVTLSQPKAEELYEKARENPETIFLSLVKFSPEYPLGIVMRCYLKKNQK